MLKEYLSEKKETVEKELIKKLEKYKYPETLSEAMTYAVMNGGKRIRPIIMYMICDLFSENNNKDKISAHEMDSETDRYNEMNKNISVSKKGSDKGKYNNIKDIATALEFIHCYSLVHDDLPAMDNDMYRRGKLTTHIKYGEATGILTGDVLLTEAFNVIAESEYISDKIKVEVIRKLSEYAGFYGMVGGQFVDTESEHKKISYDTLKYIHSNKTGKLITAAVELPLIALNIGKDEKEKLIEYSKIIGTAFQIKDDILDIEGSFEEIGKQSSDEKSEKSTYPSLFGLEKSKELLNEHILEAKKILKDNFKNNLLLLELTDYIGNRGV